MDGSSVHRPDGDRLSHGPRSQAPTRARAGDSAAIGRGRPCRSRSISGQCAACRTGSIRLAGTNALPTMARWGGLDELVGIDPLGMRLPRGREFVARARHRVQDDGAWPEPRLPAERPSRLRKVWAVTRTATRPPDPTTAIEALDVPSQRLQGDRARRDDRDTLDPALRRHRLWPGRRSNMENKA